MNTGIRLEILKEETCSDGQGLRCYDSIKTGLEENGFGDRGPG